MSVRLFIKDKTNDIVHVGNDRLTQIDANCFKGLKQNEGIELDEILNSEAEQ